MICPGDKTSNLLREKDFVAANLDSLRDIFYEYLNAILFSETTYFGKAPKKWERH